MINKQKNYKKQMLHDNTRRTNVLIIDDYDLWKQNRANDHVEIQNINFINNSKNKQQTKIRNAKTWNN